MLRKAFDVASASGLTVETLAKHLGWNTERCRELLGIAAPAVSRRPRLQLISQELQ
jgi:hypothetical protein